MKVAKPKKERNYTLTTPTIALTEYLHKLGLDEDKNILQESIRVLRLMLTELEVEHETGAVQ